MRRLARFILAASMAFVFAAPTYASPPPAIAPIPSVAVAGSVQPALTPVSTTATPISGRAPNRPIPTDSPDAPTVVLSRMDAARAWTLATLGPAQSACLWALADWESHTMPYVTNATSGAFGLWQIKPPSKLKDWATSQGIVGWWLPLAQAQWASEYAVTRYGSACNATWFHTAHGWW